MDTTFRDKPSIEKLVGSNWQDWKYQMQVYLKATGSWPHVQGTAVLADDATDQDRRQFEHKGDVALAEVILRIDSSLTYLVRSKDTAKEAWDALTGQFERQTLSSKLYLKKMYFRKEMKEGVSMQQHLKEMKEITDRLGSLGSPVSEEDQVVTLLGSLPRSFDSLVTALEAQNQDVALDFVQNSLLNEEQKRQSNQSHGYGDEQGGALVAGSKGHNGRNHPDQRLCFGCHKPGHMRKDCPTNPYQNQDSRKKFGRAKHRAKFAGSLDHKEGGFVATVARSDTKVNNWYLDSGATAHMTSDRKMLRNYQDLVTPEPIGLADGESVDAMGKGTVQLQLDSTRGKPVDLVLHEVLYVPQLAANLFSIRAFTAAHKSFVLFGHSKCWLKGKEGQIIGTGTVMGTMYELDIFEKASAQIAYGSDHESSWDLWHRRLGHLNQGQLGEMLKSDVVVGLKPPPGPLKLQFCEPCAQGKMHKLPCTAKGEISSSRCLELVHTDVWGPTETGSLGGCHYFVTFIDDYSRYCQIYFMRNKSDVFEKFREYEAKVKRLHQAGIGTLRSDNGGEYVSREFDQHLRSLGIRHEKTVPYTPQQNGVAERMNRTLVEKARTMICESGLPKSLWAEAVSTATYLRNRTISRSFKAKSTPYHRWFGKKASIRHLRVFGSEAHVHVPDHQRGKLDPKAKKMFLVGYSTVTKGYRLYDKGARNVNVRKDVVFNEGSSYQAPMRKSGAPNRSQDEVTLESEPVSDLNLAREPGDPPPNEPEPEPEPEEVPLSPVITPRRSNRIKRPPNWEFRQKYAHMALHVREIQEPLTLHEALSGEHHEKWQEAVESEYSSLLENKTWKLVPLPTGRSAIKCKWTFKVKYKEDGAIERYKARLVAKGFSQKYGIDYDETFAPVVRFTSVRMLLAYAARRGMVVHQMDVVTAFLNGALEEEIYMEQPEGYRKAGSEGLVCRLDKSLYGLKQSPRCWNRALRDFLLSIGFKQAYADACVYVRSVEFIAVYVDDLIIATSSEKDMKVLKGALRDHFKMKDMGILHYCLGISIIQSSKGIAVHQKHYVEKMLDKFGLLDAKSAPTPADPSVTLVKDDGFSKPVDKEMYQAMVGSLLYAATATRPDIAQAVGMLCKFNSSPSEAHFTAAKRVLRYLKGTSEMGLLYASGGPGDYQGFSDADWAGDRDDRHSTSGFVFLLADAAVSWHSKKQATVALSTSEAEYIALSSATQEAIWGRSLLGELGDEQEAPTTLWEDNQGAICLAKNPISHSRTKHIHIRYHFIREAVQGKDVELQYCPSKEMVADALTKPLPRPQFERLRSKMGMVSLQEPIIKD